MSEKGFSRRDFLKAAGGVGAGSLALRVIPGIGDVAEAFAANRTDLGVGEAARSYEADTYEKARQISIELLGHYPLADPSNICGPLSYAIAMGIARNQDATYRMAGNKYAGGTAPYEWWLASPGGASTNPRLFDFAFPQEEYDTFRVKESIATADFDNLPEVGKLEPGDFLYLDGGSYRHWITVSRRDREGRLYCTSNIPIKKVGDRTEFHIKEVMLWDPNTKDGYMRNFAKGIGPERATVGTEGFYVWRKKKVEGYKILDDPVSEKYRSKFTDIMMRMKARNWNIRIEEMGKGLLFEWRDGVQYHCASTIKVPLAIAMIQNVYDSYGERIKNEGLQSVLNSVGTDGRTLDQLISSMLVKSEESATESCKKIADTTQKPLNSRFKDMGLTQTSYHPRRSNQRDLSRVWNGLFSGEFLPNEATQYLLGKLSERTPNDDTMIGVLRQEFPSAKQWNKRGTVVEQGLYTRQDIGVVQINGRYFYLGFSGFSVTGKEMNDDEMRLFIEILCRNIADYIRESDYYEQQQKNKSSKKEWF